MGKAGMRGQKQFTSCAPDMGFAASLWPCWCQLHAFMWNKKQCFTRSHGMGWGGRAMPGRCDTARGMPGPL